MMKFRPVHAALLAAAVGAALVPVVRRRMRHAGSPNGPEQPNGSKDQSRARTTDGGESHRKGDAAHSSGSQRAAAV